LGLSENLTWRGFFIMRSFAHVLPRLILLVGAVTFGSAPSSARADFAIRLSESGYADQTYTWGSNSNPSGVSSNGSAGNMVISINSFTFGDFTLNMSFAKSNSPGGTQALVQQGNGLLDNNATGSRTLTISVSSTDFSSPISPPPLNVISKASGTAGTADVSGTFTSYVDTTNALFGTKVGTDTISFNTAQTGGVYSQAIKYYPFSPTSAYSVSDVGVYTLTGGSGGNPGEVTISGGNTTVMVPAPTGLLLALTGLPLLGLGWWCRRRRPQAVLA
jgi:hypothetical protein